MAQSIDGWARQSSDRVWIDRFGVAKDFALSAQRDARAHQRRNPLVGTRPINASDFRLGEIEAVEQPADVLETFDHAHRSARGANPQSRVMQAIVVEGFADIGHAAGEGNGGPEPGIAAENQAFIGAADRFVGGLPEDGGAGVGDWSHKEKIVATFLAAVHAVIGVPSARTFIRSVLVMEALAATVRSNLPRAAIGVADGVVIFEDGEKALEEAFVGIVVRFGDPKVFAARETHTFVPLAEGAAGIRFVEFGADPRIAGILREDGAALVGGTIVQKDQFEILIGLAQNAFDALRQKSLVVVIGDDHADGWHRNSFPE